MDADDADDAAYDDEDDGDVDGFVVVVVAVAINCSGTAAVAALLGLSWRGAHEHA